MDALALRSAGIEQTENMKRFLWDNHFAAIASDMPSLEVCTLCLYHPTHPGRAERDLQRWPPAEGTVHLHSTLLGCVNRS